jgi:hypothetical protein
VAVKHRKRIGLGLPQIAIVVIHQLGYHEYVFFLGFFLFVCPFKRGYCLIFGKKVKHFLQNYFIFCILHFIEYVRFYRSPKSPYQFSKNLILAIFWAENRISPENKNPMVRASDEDSTSRYADCQIWHLVGYRGEYEKVGCGFWNT